ncbi:MAG TPA: S4 domain-containing protein, partial [Opitutaceae bacterium]|nr:S4 domain-containing protein [Opitutaceae bacterium]
DADVVKLLKTLTFLSESEIAALEQEVRTNPGARLAQKTLAKEMTALVHGPDRLAGAIKASEVLFGGAIEGLSVEDFQDVVAEAPNKDIDNGKLAAPGLPIVDALVHCGLCPSKGQARKDVEGGGIYVNNVRVGEIARVVTTGDLLFGKYVLLRKGKRTYAVLKAV